MANNIILLPKYKQINQPILVLYFWCKKKELFIDSGQRSLFRMCWLFIATENRLEEKAKNYTAKYP